MELSVADVSLLVAEIAPRIAGCRIRNVYQVAEESFVVALRSVAEKLELHITPGHCVFLTTRESEKPLKPSRLATAFRSAVRGAKVEELTQVSGERLLEIKMRKGDLLLTLVVELLPRGSMLVLGPEGEVITATRYRRMRDRAILPKTRYTPPPLRKSMVLEGNFHEFVSDRRGNRRAIASVLASDGGMGGRYAEEMLHIAQVDPKKKASSLTNQEEDQLQSSLISLRQNLRSPQPVLATSPKGEALPLPYAFTSLRLRGYSFVPTESFNEAVARAKALNNGVLASSRREREMMAKAKQAERAVAEKGKAISEVAEKAASLRREAETMLSNAHLLEQIVETVRRRKDSGLGWEESWSGAAMPSGVKLVGFRPEKRAVTLELRGVRMELAPSRSVASQASSKYEEAKKLERAERRIQDGLEKSRAELLRLKVSVTPHETPAIKSVKREKRRGWHERFRWFRASTGELVVGGRDEQNNEALVSHHADKNDMVFHAEIRGAPIVVVKSSGNPSPEALRQAAQFAASYSRGWREGLGSMSVYHVKPDQISKSAPTGEYLPKGSFHIQGKRNYVKTELRMAIGLSRKGQHVEMVSGPPEAVAHITPRYMELTPGNTPAKRLAERTIALLLGEESLEMDREAKHRLLEDVKRAVPFGRGSLSRTPATLYPKG